ncbi:MAG TPA: hypothetical protein VK629_02320 [Steroidobacteraceae bacterium]|nr:hypothetical protein [Steroidobacteraceae bacterium]
MANYTRNIQGHQVSLTLIEVDPDAVSLDPTNPRIGFSMKQLQEHERSDAASSLLLTSQEDTEALKRSIILSNGVQEPIYLRADGRVAEGNRRVVALRAAKEQFPGDVRFAKMPGWLISADTPEPVIQDLLNEIHLGSVRGWAPYEKALQMRGLINCGLTDEEVAERYRMTAREVRQQIAAVEFMDSMYFPITTDPTDPEHRSKFSYFLEFHKNTRLQSHCERNESLPADFCRWVRDENVDTGARVRKLAKVLDSAEATRLLDSVGFEAAEKYLEKQNPSEQELYALLARAQTRLEGMTVNELVELGASEPRREVLESLKAEIDHILEIAARTKKAS